MSKWELRAKPGLKKDEVMTITTRAALILTEAVGCGVSENQKCAILTENVELGLCILMNSRRYAVLVASLFPSKSEQASNEETDVQR